MHGRHVADTGQTRGRHVGLPRDAAAMIESRELEEKTERIVHLLAAENLGAVLVGAQHNFAWLTGGGRNGIDLSRDAGACALLVRRDGRRFVLANNIEMPRLLSEELAGQDYEP